MTDEMTAVKSCILLFRRESKESLLLILRIELISSNSLPLIYHVELVVTATMNRSEHMSRILCVIFTSRSTAAVIHHHYNSEA